MARKNRFKRYRVSIASKLKYENLPYKEKLKKVFKILLIIVILYVFLGRSTGLIHLVEMKVEKSKLQQELEQINEENRQTAREIETLRSDTKAIERIAREELGLVKKGEIVYKFITLRDKDR